MRPRDRSGSYAHADARFAAALAFVTLLFALFSTSTFAPLWVAVDVAIGYGAGILASRSSPAIRLFMTPARDRARKVPAPPTRGGNRNKC